MDDPCVIQRPELPHHVHLGSDTQDVDLTPLPSATSSLSHSLHHPHRAMVYNVNQRYRPRTYPGHFGKRPIQTGRALPSSDGSVLSIWS